ncbi:MAG: FAD-binding oxidoreductase [Limnospira sp. PMC 894.15]|uniref:FAD-binding oxidoreductase n=1 Tax=Limnospira sp. PMC 894.15 TaxID=2981100 RepID=UPI0028E0C74C|nr:FAD-binding oxidoreductase [Limnospira sp. PMC 894.15]MDT9189981.1 FAD-binding oxidoreductase [Limnospira sp. PMC 894.15]
MSIASQELSQTSKPLNLEEIATVAANSNLCTWDDLDQSVRANLEAAIAPGSAIQCVLYPPTQEELAAITTYAARHQLGILPFGKGSKITWGNPVKNPSIAISTQKINRLVEHAVGDLTVTVEAGMQYRELQQILAKQGQFLGFDPCYQDDATIGGIIATGDSGSLRHRYRGIRDMLLGISFVRSDGKIAKAGGRVVKNVAGYDLMKLLTGSYGTLGIITQVTLRLYPCLEASHTVLLTGDSDAIATCFATILASALTPVAMDLISPELVARLSGEKSMGLAVRFQSIRESVELQGDRLVEVGNQLNLNSTIIRENDGDFWQQLKQQIWQGSQGDRIICKVGITPTDAATTLAKCQTPAVIHGSSGLGLMRFDETQPEPLQNLRQLCNNQGGFLSVLEAPLTIKQQIEVWGYRGNALDLMAKIKQQFDPQNLLNHQRFLAGL